MCDTNKNAVLSYSSFDGGGPAYKVKVEDESVAQCVISTRYHNKEHENMCGSGYDVYITFTGLKAGKTTAKIECRSPIAENYDVTYDIEVGDDFTVTLTERELNELLL